LAWLDPLYADEVNFYGNTISRAEVLTEKRLFTERWPERNYRIQPKSMNAVCDESRPGLTQSMECIVTGTVEWQTRSPARNATASGLAGFTYVLGASGGTFLIKGEHGSAPQPPPSTQKRDAQVHIQVQVIEGLQLREQPDPRARNILGAPPNDNMPKGSQVAVIDTCRTWMGSGRGAQDADNIWCPVLYEGHRGWANAYYLADRGERVACVMYPTARGCASTTQLPESVKCLKPDGTEEPCESRHTAQPLTPEERYRAWRGEEPRQDRPPSTPQESCRQIDNCAPVESAHPLEGLFEKTGWPANRRLQSPSSN
jgi:hypothetical protein